VKREVILITGCSSGIGKALAKEFHAQGSRVIATARRLDSLDELKSMGMSVELLDVTDEKQIKRVIAGILEREHQIDILINNAGYGLMGPVVDLAESDILSQFQTNVFAPLALIRATVPSMKQNGSGLIINIGSISGVTTTPFAGAYCASKAALHSLSDALRMELAPFGIRVVTVQPGGISSNFGSTAHRIVQTIVKPHSWYAEFKESIDRRALESQSNAMDAKDFARRLVRIVSKNNPPAIVRLGGRSFLLPFLKSVLPPRVLDSILGKRYGLAQKTR
jgi:short-subunit dehydrogenase